MSLFQYAKEKTKQFLQTAFVLACLCVLTGFIGQNGLISTAHAFSSTGEDDTILVETPHKVRFSYSTAIKAFSKKILDFDLDEFFTGGQNCKEAVVRNFSQLAERTHYKFNLKQDKVELNFTLNF